MGCHKHIATRGIEAIYRDYIPPLADHPPPIIAPHSPCDSLFLKSGHRACTGSSLSLTQQYTPSEHHLEPNNIDGNRFIICFLSKIMKYLTTFLGQLDRLVGDRAHQKPGALHLRETRKKVTRAAKATASVKGDSANSVDVRKVYEKATAETGAGRRRSNVE